MHCPTCQSSNLVVLPDLETNVYFLKRFGCNDCGLVFLIQPEFDENFEEVRRDDIRIFGAQSVVKLSRRTLDEDGNEVIEQLN